MNIVEFMGKLAATGAVSIIPLYLAYIFIREVLQRPSVAEYLIIAATVAVFVAAFSGLGWAIAKIWGL